MQQGQLFVTIMAGVISAAVGGSVSVSAKENDSLITAPRVGFGLLEGTARSELDVRHDHQGRLLVNPDSGEVIGIILNFADEPEIKPYTLRGAQLEAAMAARLSVTDVIATVEQQSSGCKVLEVSFEPTASAATYVLKTYRDNTVWEGKINADSGVMLDAGKTIPDSKLDADDKAELSGLASAVITIVQAVRIAEQHAQGKAIAVGLEESDAGGALWEVVVVTGDTARRMFIDPATGQMKPS
jgi:uncharacterized membrane protein YkoI